MINPHTSVGIAQVVFYAPMLPAAIFCLVKNWNNRPRMAWYPLVSFCLLRLAGGIISIVRSSNQDDIGLIIADFVLLNIGLIPLLVSLLGITRITLKSSLDENSRARQFLKLVRIIFFAAIVLIVVGGGLSSNDSTTSTARALNEAAYVILAVILLLATTENLYLLTQKHRISPSGYYYVHFALLAVPFLAVRTAYGLLYTFTSDNLYSMWDPIFGSAVAFALMCLLPEYIVLLIFLYLGFHRMRNPVHPPQMERNGERLDQGHEPPHKVEVSRGMA